MYLLKLAKDTFTFRQSMRKNDFECYHYIDDSPLYIPFHDHEFYEIFFFLSGNASYIIEGRTYQLRAGDILLTDNKDIHRPVVYKGKTYERFVLWIDPVFLSDLSSEDCDLTSCFYASSEKKYKLIRPDGSTLTHLKSIFEKMLESCKSSEFGCNLLSKIYLTEFLVYLNRAYFATGEDIIKDITQNKKINEVIEYINNHLNEELTLDILSNAVYVSKSHLGHLFKTYTGLTLYQYIIKKRLTTARNMLKMNTPAIEACMSCGFTDYSNFLKAFKREFGTSPKSFMNKNQ